MLRVNMSIRSHLLTVVLVPTLLIMGVTSYVRFIVNHDYMVGYEGKCDPVTQTCFIGCEGDECAEPYYYSEIEKYAADLYAQCGPDISNCPSAQMCQEGERACSITYCDSEIDGDMCEAEEAAPDDMES